MSDLYGRQDQVLLGALNSDDMFMTWPELAAVGGGLGMLIQNISLDYSQPIRRVFELGPGVVPSPLAGLGLSAFASAAFCDGPSANSLCQFRAQPVYYIIGRPEGRMQSDKFVGPNVLGAEFYRAYGNGCSPNVISLSGTAGCRSGGGQPTRMTWTMNGLTINNYNMRTSGQEQVMQEAFAAMFTGLSLVAAADSLVGSNGVIATSGSVPPTPGSGSGSGSGSGTPEPDDFPDGSLDLPDVPLA